MFNWIKKDSKMGLINEIKDLIARVENAKGFDGKEGRWITVKGTHVFVPDGRDEGEVIAETFGEKGESKEAKKDSLTELKAERKKVTEQRISELKEIKSKLNDLDKIEDTQALYDKADKISQYLMGTAGILSEEEQDKYLELAEDIKDKIVDYNTEKDEKKDKGFEYKNKSYEEYKKSKSQLSESKGGKEKYKTYTEKNYDEFHKKFYKENTDKWHFKSNRDGFTILKGEGKQGIVKGIKPNETDKYLTDDTIKVTLSNKPVKGKDEWEENDKKLKSFKDKGYEVTDKYNDGIETHYILKINKKAENSLADAFCEALAEALTEE